jgi:hypothetical protein
MHGDGLESFLVTGADDPEGDLATIGDEDTVNLHGVQNID